MSRHAKSQLLHLQMIMLKVASAYAGSNLSMQMAELCYTQLLNNGIFTACEYSFNPLYHTREIYMSIKDLENLAELNLLQNLHLCTQNSVCATN